MVAAATKSAFEVMTEAGSGDAGALAVGLRRGVTGLGLRALAAKALHAAAAAPERISDIYENASAGWLGGPVFAPKLRTDEPLPISPAFWEAFWELVDLPPDTRQRQFAGRVMGLAGELDPGINARMAPVAREFPGVVQAAAGRIPRRHDLDALANHPPASLGYAYRQAMLKGGGLAEPFDHVVPLLRHMPPPLNHINVQVIQSLTLWRLVAGYSSAWMDEVAMGGFLMAQLGHHYSALSTATTLTIIALKRPKGLEVTLDCIFRGWAHGRETPPLISVSWDEFWALRMDQVREAAGITPFDSPYAAAMRRAHSEATKH
ncbi:hypothetical protein [uncultured Phenylobacterium sp.]|uniref:hypothetical protein n=1 Tax=uncultured Phenylobacterium sp. TaxID=349273 RepID=UPI0025EF8B3A|nr:hypothetical protein [uncultured Phenylobacterium sp.]